MRRVGGQRGQAAVELVAVLPALAVVALAAWWVLASAATWMQAGGAARAGARAAGVGEPAAGVVHGVTPAARVAVGHDAAGGQVVSVRLAAPGLPGLPALRIRQRMAVVAP